VSNVLVETSPDIIDVLRKLEGPECHVAAHLGVARESLHSLAGSLSPCRRVWVTSALCGNRRVRRER